MRLGVGERERAAPRPSEHEPAIDAEVYAQGFDVGHQVPGGVVDQRGVRLALAATALVEEHDAIAFWVEEATLPRARPTPWAAMQKHRRLAARIPGLFEINRVFRGYLEVA